MKVQAKNELTLGELEDLECSGVELSPDQRRQLAQTIHLLEPAVAYLNLCRHADEVIVASAKRDETERLAAAERLRDKLPYLLHRVRRRIVSDALGGELLAKGLQDLAIANIFLAMPTLRDRPVGDADNLSVLAAGVSERLTEELLGPKWRHRHETAGVRQVPIDEATDASIAISEEAEAETKLALLQELPDRRNLSLRERDVVRALLEHEGEVKAAAKALGISPTTASVHLRNIRKKNPQVA